jgi:Arc/MetJ-type ribon-helix-helix transcriptional regulator
MDGERITLRLGAEELDLIDRFIDESDEISNRSQLARIAIRSYIEGVSSRPSTGADNRISVEVPRPALSAMRGLVRDGIYKSVAEAIESSVRDQYITKEYRQRLLNKALDEELETVKMVSD